MLFRFILAALAAFFAGVIARADAIAPSEGLTIEIGAMVYRIPRFTVQGGTPTGGDLARLVDPKDKTPLDERLAHLTAARVVIPEISGEAKPGERQMRIVYKDVVLEDVAAGRIGAFHAASLQQSADGLGEDAIGAVEAHKMIPRDGVKSGDRIYVTGTIGDAALGLKLRRGASVDQDWIGALSETDACFLRDRYLLPQPRLALRGALKAFAHAAMDVSDGLAGDLGKMLRLTGMTATIELARIPLSGAARRALQTAPRLVEAICAGGDDYEILCAAPPTGATAFEAAAAAAGIGVSQLADAAPGEAVPGFIDAEGEAIHLARTSFQHF